MANFTFTIPDAQLGRVVDAFAAVYGYRATLPDGTANPETRAQFTRRHIRQFIIEVVKGHEASQAAEQARTDAAAAVESGVAVT